MNKEELIAALTVKFSPGLHENGVVWNKALNEAIALAHQLDEPEAKGNAEGGWMSLPTAK